MSKLGTGHYRVTFERSVLGCPAVASPGAIRSGSFQGLGVAALLEPGAGDPNAVEVFTNIPVFKTSSNRVDAPATDTDFNLVVAC